MFQLLLFYGIIISTSKVSGSGEFTFPVRMPNIRSSNFEEMYLCTGVRIPEDQDLYNIVGFEPAARQDNVHHMLMFACENPGMESSDGSQAVWACGHDPAQGQLYRDAPTCSGASEILYAWARDANKLDLPDNVGFHVGKRAGSKHIVIQVHYKDMKTDSDSSGVNIRMTTEEQPKRAGVLIMGHMGSIPPKSTVYLETSCQFPNGNLKIHPFGFRTHTHNLGTVVSGYKISPDRDNWTLIGKMDPRRPQTFYPIQTEDLVINGGDYIAARCTMVSDRSTTTYMGSTNNDEMCNYYLMYYVDPKESILFDKSRMGCWSGENRSWGKIFTNIPDDASSFEGTRYEATP